VPPLRELPGLLSSEKKASYGRNRNRGAQDVIGGNTVRKKSSTEVQSWRAGEVEYGKTRLHEQFKYN